jgi:Cache 3/Cache 2 fusion domain
MDGREAITEILKSMSVCPAKLFLRSPENQSNGKGASIMLKKLMVCIMAVMFIVGTSQAFAEDTDAKVKESMKLLQEKAKKLGEAKVEGTDTLEGKTFPALFFGTTKMNGNYALVDEVKGAMGGTATIFVKQDKDFVRITTNVMKEGKRAVGTVLDPKGKAYAALSAGMPFYGVVDILGMQYNTGYEPIKNAKGEVIGIFYVGYPIEKK